MTDAAVPFEVVHTETLVSTHPALLDVEVIYGFLSTCYWSPGIPRDLLIKAMANSLNFGLYLRGENKPAQIGFARVITDRATYAYLCDVFIVEAHRGRGFSKQLMAAVLAHPDLRRLRRFALFTRDAHKVYAPFGFKNLDDPSRYMDVHVPAPELYREKV